MHTYLKSLLNDRGLLTCLLENVDFMFSLLHVYLYNLYNCHKLYCLMTIKFWNLKFEKFDNKYYVNSIYCFFFFFFVLFCFLFLFVYLFDCLFVCCCWVFFWGGGGFGFFSTPISFLQELHRRNSLTERKL
jgi:hypothetical protein